MMRVQYETSRPIVIGGEQLQAGAPIATLNITAVGVDLQKFGELMAHAKLSVRSEPAPVRSRRPQSPAKDIDDS